MAIYYWGNGGTSGTGTWNTVLITNWYLDAGRTIPAATSPTLADDVVIDSTSGTGSITVSGGVCNNLTVTASQAITLNSGAGTLSVYGSLSLPSGGSFALGSSSVLAFTATSTGKTITTNNKTLPSITFNGVGGGWTLQDDFTVSGSQITLTNGSLNTNSKAVTTNTFVYSATGTASLTLGSSTVSLQSGPASPLWGFGTTTGLTFSGASSTILCTVNTGNTAKTFAGGGLTYGTLTIAGTATNTFTITGANTFGTLNSTKTVAFTISFGANQTITTWSVTGSAGNVVTVNSNTVGTARTLTITNQTLGIDYLDIQDIISNLTPVTFYAGANTKLRSGVQGVAAKAPTANQYVYVLNSGTSWAVPANWNNSNNEIHLFAGGGGGAAATFTTPNGAGGGGGGGGGYTKATNVTLSGSISYAIGAGGTNGTTGANAGAGGATTFNSSAYTTTGGGGGRSTSTSSTGGAGGTGSTNNGGTGGVGAISTVASTGLGGGGGAGAGGPLGVGQNGGNGFGSTTAAQVAGGGGGGNGGGSAGGNATSATGGTGGNNNAGVGGGASNTSGFNGGGGGGNTNISTGSSGSSGVDIANAGMGGGSGGGGGAGNAISSTNFAGLYGGGGVGGGLSIAGAARTGSAGAQGGIIIVYSTSSTPVNSGFFFLFG